MLNGDFNVYWHHDTITPYAVRAACYGTAHNSGGLVPEVDDVINGFHGHMGEPTTVRVTEVEQFGQGVVAFKVTVTTVEETSHVS
jgi:hypothetical protein